jgi:hypothetical protein
MEINGNRSQSPCTMSVYGVERRETGSIYGGRKKIWSFKKVIFDTPFMEINDNRLLSYVIVYTHTHTIGMEEI